MARVWKSENQFHRSFWGKNFGLLKSYFFMKFSRDFTLSHWKAIEKEIGAYTIEGRDPRTRTSQSPGKLVRFLVLGTLMKDIPVVASYLLHNAVHDDIRNDFHTFLLKKQFLGKSFFYQKPNFGENPKKSFPCWYKAEHVPSFQTCSLSVQSWLIYLKIC